MVLLNMPKTIRFQAITHWAHKLETKLYFTQQNKKQTQTNKKQKPVKDLHFLFWRDFQGQPQGCKSINPGLGTSAPPSGLFPWEVTQWHFYPFYPGPTTQILSYLLSETFKAVLPFWWSWFACLWTNESPVSEQMKLCFLSPPRKCQKVSQLGMPHSSFLSTDTVLRAIFKT